MSDNETTSWEPYLNELSEAFAKTDNPVLIREFLGSLLTPNELQEVSTRWALVKLIDDGMSQRNIARELGLSLCKITRGSKELKKENSPFQEMIGIYKTPSRS
ncbi:MAG: transcriptional regulator [Spirochaetales bacterium]|nr:transcriptional regulator [Spirochaetales bacterium]